MATIGDGDLTLLDYAKRLDPSGAIAPIVEQLSKTNEILEDLVFLEGNLQTGHRTTIRKGLPAVGYRKVNEGVATDKSQTEQVDETCGRMESLSKLDEMLAELSANGQQFRHSEDMAFIEAMNQQAATDTFYANAAANPEKFTGLSPRYASTTASNGENILLGDGVGADNTSIWLVVHGAQTFHGIFPKGTKAGWEMNDLGKILTTVNSKELMMWTTQFVWRLGMVLRDWRYVVRIANVDVSNLTKDAATGSDVVDLMTQALDIPPHLNGAKFYCNKDIRSVLRRQMRNAKNVNLSLDEVAGRKVVHLDEVPVRRCDGILNTEVLVA